MKKIVVKSGQYDYHLIEEASCCIALCGAGVANDEIIREKIPDDMICEKCLKKAD